MGVEEFIQYGSMTIAIMLLILKRKGMKQYVPVGMFASLYANVWCYIAKYFDLWYFPSRIFPIAEDISIPVNMVVVPIIAMFWVRYYPVRFKEKLLWVFGATTILTIIEVLIEKFTDALAYGNGYQWYYSYILWFFSWFIWLGFHQWLYNGHREFDSLLKK